MQKQDKEQRADALLISSIGRVHNKFDKPTSPEDMRSEESAIVLYPQYKDGLYKIEDYKHLYVIFYFHRSKGYKLIAKRRFGGVKGVFASRSPRRPVPVGLCRVELLGVDDDRLLVRGLDAMNGTPVLDIKPCFN